MKSLDVCGSDTLVCHFVFDAATASARHGRVGRTFLSDNYGLIAGSALVFQALNAHKQTETWNCPCPEFVSKLGGKLASSGG
jgi:hypothetical protein